MGARQRSGRAKASCGETLVQKRVFGESVFPLCPLKVFRTLQVFLRANLKGAEKKRTLQKHPFGQPFLRTTPSPLLWRTLSYISFGHVSPDLCSYVWGSWNISDESDANFEWLPVHDGRVRELIIHPYFQASVLPRFTRFSHSRSPSSYCTL